MVNNKTVILLSLAEHPLILANVVYVVAGYISADMTRVFAG